MEHFSFAPRAHTTEEETVTSRGRIGFRPPPAWVGARATFTEHALVIDGHPVMEDWEGNYMRTLAEIATASGGRVLEVGFGMGISAREVQARAPQEHLIIEANRDVYDRLRTFAQSAAGFVTPLFGFWQEVTPSIPNGSLSGILFDTYPLSPDEVHRNHFPFFKEAHRLLAPGGVLTYYSDEPTDFSPEHRQALLAAGFTDIQGTLCPVTPPPDCLYWKHNTILAPHITKRSA